MTADQRRVLASEPIDQMRRFAAFLHWHGLQLERVLFTDDEIRKWNMPPTGITYYMTTDPKFNLQISEFESAPPFTHQATIKADRYGISNVGWHPFTLFEDGDKLRAEAERLRPWLDRVLYKNRKWLRDFKVNHPEMLLPSRKRRRGCGRVPSSRKSPGDHT